MAQVKVAAECGARERAANEDELARQIATLYEEPTLDHRCQVTLVFLVINCVYIYIHSYMYIYTHTHMYIK